MADLKPVYLIHGEDEVKLDASRNRAHERACEENASLEPMHGERDAGEDVALALASLTLSMGRRYLLVDGIERWKDKDVTVVAQALAAPAPDTVVFFVGTERKDSRGKKWSPPAKLVKAVEKAGGEVLSYPAPKPSQLVNWIIKKGEGLGLSFSRDAAQSLYERAGTETIARRDLDRKSPQRRLMRELERIACYAPEGGRVDVDLIEQVSVYDVEAQAYELADAVIDGDRARSLFLAEDLSLRDADIMHILYAMLGRVHDMRLAWAVIESGGSSNDVEKVVSGPPWKAKRLASQARNADGKRLERIAASLADLDFAVRGGGNVDTETALTLTLAAAA